MNLHRPRQTLRECQISIGKYSGIVLLCLLAVLSNVYAGPGASVIGQTGLVNMPDARIAPEGTLRLGYSYYEPYPTLWSSISLFSRVEFSARYTRMMHVTAFSDVEGANYGDNKDKSFDTKLILWPESKYIPAISIGAQDFVGTQLFEAYYAALNKQISDIDISVGYGEKRINGWFGGVRYNPGWHKPLGVVVEYDAFDYMRDPEAIKSGAAQKPGGVTYALEYSYGWLSSQVSYQDGDYSVSANLAIPLAEKEYIPKFEEPLPYTQKVQRPTLEQWQQDKQYGQALVTALEVQNFKNVRVQLQGDRLEVGFSQTRITLVGRAVGRAVRTALLMSPLGTQSIQLTYYNAQDLAVVTYHFTDLDELDQFFSGQVTYGQLVKYLTLTYSDPTTAAQLAAAPNFGADASQNGDFKLARNLDGHAISVSQEDTDLSQFRLVPINLEIFFNDPSGAFRYNLYAKAAYAKQLHYGLFVNTSVRLRLVENVSKVTQASNSELPHVRTDVAEYKRKGGLELNDLTLNQYFLPATRWYARVSAGYYEEMFGGAGGQLLYLPKESGWGFDVSVDWLKQRDYNDGLKFRDYETVTAIGAVHYAFKKIGLSVTARGGRFLAKDNGVRMEFLKRFRSGARVGAWFTVTDGKDETGPGSPGNPYYDKGIFFSIPLSTMLTKDTRATSGFALAPWTRDVGQMVRSPGDLYESLSDPLLLDRPEQHLLSDFHL